MAVMKWSFEKFWLRRQRALPLPEGEARGEGEKRAPTSNLNISPSAPASSNSGMTVLELLIVIAIITLLSALAVPAIRALTRSNTISSANRQLLDDIALARQRAINEHSIVHLLFVQTNVMTLSSNTKTPQNTRVLLNLMTGGQTR